MATVPLAALHSLDRSRVPVLLLGGVNLVRCLGLAGIPAIVASPDPAEPAFASRYCRASVVLPPYDHPKVVSRLLALGEQLRSIGRSTDRPFCVNLVLAFDQAERLELVGMLVNHQIE